MTVRHQHVVEIREASRSPVDGRVYRIGMSERSRIPGVQDAQHVVKLARVVLVHVEVAGDEDRFRIRQSLAINELFDNDELLVPRLTALEGVAGLGVGSEDVIAPPVLLDPRIEDSFIGQAITEVTSADVAVETLRLARDRPAAHDDDSAVLLDPTVCAEYTRSVWVLSLQVGKNLIPDRVVKGLREDDHVESAQLRRQDCAPIGLIVEQHVLRSHVNVVGQHIETVSEVIASLDHSLFGRPGAGGAWRQCQGAEHNQDETGCNNSLHIYYPSSCRRLLAWVAGRGDAWRRILWPWRRRWRRRRLALLNLDLSDNWIPVLVAPVGIYVNRHASEQRRERNLQHGLRLRIVELILRPSPPGLRATMSRRKVSRHGHVQTPIIACQHFYHTVISDTRAPLGRCRGCGTSLKFERAGALRK